MVDRVCTSSYWMSVGNGGVDVCLGQQSSFGQATVERIRRRFVEAGLEAINERPRPGARPCFSAKAEARLVAEACSQAPSGRSRWTMRLLAGRVVELGLAESCSHETVRRVLKKRGSSRG